MLGFPLIFNVPRFFFRKKVFEVRKLHTCTEPGYV
jgi:hypothetical protein